MFAVRADLENFPVFPLHDGTRMVLGDFMLAPNSIAERIQLLRSQVRRYQLLAEGLYDRRIADEVAGVADELQAELARLECWQDSFGRKNMAHRAIAS
jgi:hypothetical protein